ncbi:hypothetical protein ACKQTC_07085 [Peptococcus simiae]|uniref:Uncharacterized protein n=1 Tax=Peptococcus simiae TaxID=1643805 RepID=A0ABW9GZZ8_9FIRM
MNYNGVKDRIPEKLKVLLGCKYNQPTPRLKDEENLVQKYEHLCLRDKNIMWQESSLEELLKDIDEEILKTGLSKEALFLEIEKYRHVISREKNYGGFGKSIFPSVVKMIGGLTIFCFSLTSWNIIDIIKWTFDYFGNYSFSVITIILLAIYLYKVFGSRKYEENMNKYYDFLISYLVMKK